MSRTQRPGTRPARRYRRLEPATGGERGTGQRRARSAATVVVVFAAALLLGACQRLGEAPREAWNSPYLQCSGASTASAPLARGAVPARLALPHHTAVPVPGELLVAYRAPDNAFLEAFGRGAAGPVAGGGDLYTQALEANAAEVRTAHGLVRLGSGSPTELAGLPELVGAADADGALESLRSDPRVLYAHHNYYLETLHVPGDPLYSQQWNLSRFGMPQAWDAYLAGSKPRGAVVAIIDTGVDPHHPDLAGKLLPGWDFNGGDADTSPGTSGAAAHGTHVAGIAAASSDEVGVAGVAFAPEVRILPVKVFNDAGVGGTMADLIQAIKWAAGLQVGGAPRNEYPAQVINLSIGVAGVYPALDAAVRAAWQAGSVVVAAAGNRRAGIPDRGVLSPANAPCAIAVGSVDADRQLSSFSNTGPEVELVAPGGLGSGGCSGIISTIPGGVYGCMSGTSMATPFVAGVAALIVSQGDLSSPDDIRQRLGASASAVDRYAPDTAGHGLLCADAALGAATSCGQIVLGPLATRP